MSIVLSLELLIRAFWGREDAGVCHSTLSFCLDVGFVAGYHVFLKLSIWRVAKHLRKEANCFAFDHLSKLSEQLRSAMIIQTLDRRSKFQKLRVWRAAKDLRKQANDFAFGRLSNLSERNLFAAIIRTLDRRSEFNTL